VGGVLLFGKITEESRASVSYAGKEQRKKEEKSLLISRSRLRASPAATAPSYMTTKEKGLQKREVLYPPKKKKQNQRGVGKKEMAVNFPEKRDAYLLVGGKRMKGGRGGVLSEFGLMPIAYHRALREREKR